ncbi:prephenate dehydrogenase [Actinomadura sp. DC4]|uniref:prephenate dehydrogenase n=1 Tax=Actinomadura sp. DC4 TaxID=3055069 RepID=UPI00339D7E9C
MRTSTPHPDHDEPGGRALPSAILVRRVVVIGAGLIGTSIALAMSARGTTVWLTDRDPATAELAAGLGAGKVLDDSADHPADLAILAVPPAAVATTLRDAQKCGLARIYTDVASVKAGPLAEAARLGCDMSVFVGGHPMGGRERSGPAAARADLFLGRPWALCPSDQCDASAIGVVSALVRGCGARPLIVDAAAHDQAVALVSHAPHVVSSAMAARFGDAPESVLGLVGQGVRDVTRIAAGDPQLWLGILAANAGPVAEVLEDVSHDLALTASALRERSIGETAGAVDVCADVTDLLLRGEKGRARITGQAR